MLSTTYSLNLVYNRKLAQIYIFQVFWLLQGPKMLNFHKYIDIFFLWLELLEQALTYKN